MNNIDKQAFKLDLKGFTPKQYAALIIKDELKLSHGQGGIKMGSNRYAFSVLYRRAKHKSNAKSM